MLKLILAKLRASGIQITSSKALCQQFIARFGVGTLLHVLLTRCWDGTSCLCWSCRLCGCFSSVKRGDEGDVESPLLDEPQAYDGTTPRVTCIVTSFDAWLFADSDVLWAVLISQVFKQVRKRNRARDSVTDGLNNSSNEVMRTEKMPKRGYWSTTNTMKNCRHCHRCNQRHFIEPLLQGKEYS